MNTRGTFATGRAMFPGRVMSPGRFRGMSRRRGMRPERWQGGGAVRNSQFGSRRPGFIQHHHPGDNHRFLPSSFVHPYVSHSQQPANLARAITSRNKPLEVSPTSFYRITLFPCLLAKDPSLLLALISHALNGTKISLFVPRLRDKRFSFLVNDYKIAQQVLNQDRKISLPDGTQLSIQVKPANPVFSMGDIMKQAITSALNSTYDPNTKAVNLCKFQNNEIFTEKQLICSLNLQSVLGHVADVLWAQTPDLYALNLNENLLTSLKEAGSVLRRFKSLKVLHLAGNKIGSVLELGHLSALNLSELDLRDNDFMMSMHRCDYVTEIRSVLPSLRVLDGEVLPERIPCVVHLDVPDAPSWKSGYAQGYELQQCSIKFVQRYYELYDEMGRSKLELAYHPAAVMSLTCDLVGVSKYFLHAYTRYDRSLMIPENRQSGNSAPLLFRGPEQIVSALKTLPNSEHYFQSFTCDLLQIAGNTAQIMISGLFKEFGHNRDRRVRGQPLKHFHRCFVVLCEGNELKITNDSLVIRYLSDDQFAFVENIRKNQMDKLSTLKLLKELTLNDEI